MPISSDILTQLRKNDSTLVHLDLTFNLPLHTNEQSRLTDADMVELVEALVHNTHLKSLNLNKNKVGASGITMLATKGLEALSLSKNGLNSDCIDALLLHDMLTSLDVSGNELDDVNIAKLSQLPRLSSLDVSENAVGLLSMTAFALHPALKKLSVKHNRCERNSFERITLLRIEALEANRTLKWLDLTGNSISTASLAAFSRHPEIETLNLQGCFFYIDNFYKRTFKINNNINMVIVPLTRLSKLSWLSIRGIDSREKDMDQAAIRLAPLPLKYLDISDVKMSAKGAKALARSTTLTTLIASENYIGPYGLLALARNRSITHLDISKNNMRFCWPAGKPYVAERNQVENSVNKANSSYYTYTTGIATEFMSAFAQNHILKTLDLSNQNIPYDHRISNSDFASLINANTTMMSLDISHYRDRVGSEVINALAENKTLQTITFSANLEIAVHQEALSKNFHLMTIRCLTEPHQSAPYAQKIQERNRGYRDTLAMRVLMLHALKRSHHVVNSWTRVMFTIDLLRHIATYILPPAHATHVEKIYSTALSIFSRKTEPARPALKRQRTDDEIDSIEPERPTLKQRPS